MQDEWIDWEENAENIWSASAWICI